MHSDFRRDMVPPLYAEVRDLRARIQRFCEEEGRTYDARSDEWKASPEGEQGRNYVDGLADVFADLEEAEDMLRMLSRER